MSGYYPELPERREICVVNDATKENNLSIKGTKKNVLKSYNHTSPPGFLSPEKRFQKEENKQSDAALHKFCFNSGKRSPLLKRKNKLSTLRHLLTPWKWQKKKKIKRNETSPPSRSSKIFIAKTVKRNILVYDNCKGRLHKRYVLPTILPTLYSIQEMDEDSCYINSDINTLKVINNISTANDSILFHDIKNVSSNVKANIPTTSHSSDSSNNQTKAYPLGLQSTHLTRHQALAEQLRQRLAISNNQYLHSTSNGQRPLLLGQYVFNISLTPTMKNKENAIVMRKKRNVCDDEANVVSKASLSLPLCSNKQHRRQSTDNKLKETNEATAPRLMKLLSTWPTTEEQMRHNILKMHTSDVEKKEEKKKKQTYLLRKLRFRPTVKELKEQKIIRFNDYVEVSQAHDYDRRSDKPWKRLTLKEKTTIRKELNKFKTSEMEIHESSRHLISWCRRQTVGINNWGLHHCSLEDKRVLSTYIPRNPTASANKRDHLFFCGFFFENIKDDTSSKHFSASLNQVSNGHSLYYKV
uniref:Phosphatase and actin regulator n=1 Tax=Glossina brevipalpis TaxID=37001 RepID=A0A1A9WST8_9MUSC